MSDCERVCELLSDGVPLTLGVSVLVPDSEGVGVDDCVRVGDCVRLLDCVGVDN